jgi:hypothetical protein
MTNGLHIYGEIFAHSSYIRKPFLIYDFATAPHSRKILFSFFISACSPDKVGGYEAGVHEECDG